MPNQTVVSFTLLVNSPLVVDSPAPPDATQGVAYSHQFTASGGVSPYTWALTTGALPAGLTLSTSGLLSGTPTESGSFPVQVTVTDSAS